MADLARVRKQAGVSLRTLESLSGVSRTTIHYAEKGVNSPQLDTFVAMANALGYDVALVPLPT